MTTPQYKYPSEVGRQSPVVSVTLDSATTASGSATGTWTTGMAGFKEADIYVDVTAAAGTSATLSLFIDTRFDGSGEVNVGALTLVTGTATHVAHLAKPNTPAEVVVTSDAGAGTIRGFGFGDDIRIRRNITGTSPSFSYTVHMVAVG